MAALVKHVLPNTKLFFFQNKFNHFSTSAAKLNHKKNKLPRIVKYRLREKKPDHKLAHEEPFFPLSASIMARGFLRPIKAYQPPENVEEMLQKVSKKVLHTSTHTTPLENPDIRFKLFYECEKTFNHRIPNSLLHTMRTLRDVYEFYTTPVDTRTPYDALIARDDLPPNLQIQKEPVRFHPDDDTMFKGISAFPQSSTIITGLKSRKKFKGFQAPDKLVYRGDEYD